ncbi:MAG: hypothetical protein ACYDCL_18790 [Myxococcales bacterium]
MRCARWASLLTMALGACGACRRPAEDALAAKETELARREADVARREREVEARERALAATAAPAPAPPPAAPGPAPRAREPGAPAQPPVPLHGRDEAELRHRRALDEMQSRGLLPTDLPPEAGALDRRIYGALQAGEWDRAFDLSEQLGRAIAAVEIDQRFLDAKLRRVAALRQRRKLGETAGTEVDALLQEATSLAADGQYGSANGRINRIAAMLQ